MKSALGLQEMRDLHRRYRRGEQDGAEGKQRKETQVRQASFSQNHLHLSLRPRVVLAGGEVEVEVEGGQGGAGRAPSYEKAPGVLCFSWRGNSPAKPRKRTSGERFQRGRVFVVPRSKTT